MCERTSYYMYVYVHGHWDKRIFYIAHGRSLFSLISTIYYRV